MDRKLKSKEYTDASGGYHKMPPKMTPKLQNRWLRRKRDAGLLRTCIVGELTPRWDLKLGFFLPYQTDNIVLPDAESVSCFDALIISATALLPEVLGMKTLLPAVGESLKFKHLNTRFASCVLLHFESSRHSGDHSKPCWYVDAVV